MSPILDSRRSAVAASTVQERTLRPEIRELSAYAVPDSSGMLKLDAMENPFLWPASMLEAWRREVADVAVNRYPDAAAVPLKSQLRRVMAVPDRIEILLGNGSDEIIQIIQLALAVGQRPVLATDPSFVMYGTIARWLGRPFVAVALDAQFSLDIVAMLEAIGRTQPSCVFIASPNNPTGNLFATQHIEQIIEATDGLVVIDEAYQPFAGMSLMPLLAKYDNVVILRTLSKLGLAGLRLGYLLGSIEWLREFDKVRMPYNINSLSQVSAVFALQHYDVLESQVQTLCAERQRLIAGLRQRDGLEIYPSDTNFIMFRVPSDRSESFHDGLVDHGILIKKLGGPRLAGCFRVTVGTPEQNDMFLAGLDAVLERRPDIF